MKWWHKVFFQFINIKKVSLTWVSSRASERSERCFLCHLNSSHCSSLSLMFHEERGWHDRICSFLHPTSSFWISLIYIFKKNSCEKIFWILELFFFDSALSPSQSFPLCFFNLFRASIWTSFSTLLALKNQHNNDSQHKSSSNTTTTHSLHVSRTTHKKTHVKK